jgi:hypothetical protein
MRVLLRHTRTGLFYAGPDQWTESQAGAHDFQQTDAALDRVAQAGLSPVEVVMAFENPAFEIPLQIAGLGI